MNPFLYDIQRVLRNWGVVLIIGATTCLSFVGLTIFWAIGRPASLFDAQVELADVVLIMGIIFAFFVPVLGIQTGYSTYAKDRATGILESVLVRPVTRSRVILSRFIAVAVASAVGIGLAMGVLDLLSNAETGYFLPGGQLGALYASLVVESLSFAGLLFLIAHVFRAAGTVFGLTVVIFVLIDIVWFFLLLFVGIFSGGLSGPNGLTHIVELEYADPSGYPLLLLGYAQGGLFGGLFVPPAGLLAPWKLAVAGVGWAVGPFAVAFWLARTRD